MNDSVKLLKGILAEAKKKKKEKEEKKSYDAKPDAFKYDEAFDFSSPLGADNLYARQGQVNWGPVTSAGTKLDDRVMGQKVELEAVKMNESAWDALEESLNGSIWSSINESLEESALEIIKKVVRKEKK